MRAAVISTRILAGRPSTLLSAFPPTDARFGDREALAIEDHEERHAVPTAVPLPYGSGHDPGAGTRVIGGCLWTAGATDRANYLAAPFHARGQRRGLYSGAAVLLELASSSGGTRTPSEAQRSLEARARVRMTRVDDLAAVVPFQVYAGDAEIGVPQLALDDPPARRPHGRSEPRRDQRGM